MIIYNVYKMDLDNLVLQFSTLNKEKATQFVEEYNKYYDDRIDLKNDKYFISIVNTDDVDKQADEIINSYKLKRITAINFNKYQQSYTIKYTRLKYINENKYYDSAEVYDYENDFKTWNNAGIILITDSLNIPDVNNKEVQEHMNKLIDKSIEYLQYLYEKY